ncbi:threonine synthase [Candidatus Bipolaricaulota bacterium]|nr:threonine synthase [Candidatus Bipolaricaulota bacterium]
MNFVGYKCGVCGQEFSPEEIRYRCDSCNGPLLVTYDYGSLAKKVTVKSLAEKPAGVWKYRELLPVSPSTEPVSLGEGATPLHEAKTLASSIGLSNLFLKDDGRNPTGTFKDRGATVGMTVAVERGMHAVGTVSHGNMGTSMAAYAARAGQTCYILAPEYMTSARVLYLSVYGAKVIQVVGGYDSMYDESLKIAKKHGVLFINSDNPFREEGYKTIAFEIVEDLGWQVPDWVVTPASSGGLASGLGKGFEEFKELGLIPRIPKLAVVQPSDAQPIVVAFEKSAETIKRVDHEFTSIVRSLGNPYPPSGNRVLKLLQELGGTAIAVPDEETIAAQRDLARIEGIFAEPAGAITLAGLRRLIKLGKLNKDEKVVLVVSGFGFRDPGDADKLVDKSVTIDIEDLESVIATS